MWVPMFFVTIACVVGNAVGDLSITAFERRALLTTVNNEEYKKILQIHRQ